MLLVLSALALILPALAVDEAVLSCEPGWILNGETGLCYKIVVQPMTWLNAALYCRDMDAQLPKVDNESDNFFVKHLAMETVGDVNNWWMGAHSIDLPEFDFIWLDGTPVGPYTDWVDGQPNNVEGNQHCLEYLYNQWQDEWCFHEGYFMCQKHAK